MKVTKYPHRYTISLSETEMEALGALVDHGLADMNDIDQRAAERPSVQRVLRSARWRQFGGPLLVDKIRLGRGGSTNG